MRREHFLRFLAAAFLLLAAVTLELNAHEHYAECGDYCAGELEDLNCAPLLTEFICAAQREDGYACFFWGRCNNEGAVSIP